MDWVVFMMLTGMIDVKANFKNKYNNLECEICNVKDNTQHIFSCKKYQDLNENIILKKSWKIMKKHILHILLRKLSKEKKEREEEKIRKKSTSTTPLPKGLSLRDGREWQIYL